MSFTTAVILIVLWTLGLASSWAMGIPTHILIVFTVALALVFVRRAEVRLVFAPWKAVRSRKQSLAVVDAFNGDSMYLLGRFTEPEPVALEPTRGIASKEGDDTSGHSS